MQKSAKMKRAIEMEKSDEDEESDGDGEEQCQKRTLQSCWVQGQAKIRIIDDASGVIKPGRMALLLGPLGCGKTSLLKALSGNLNSSLKGKILIMGTI
ncbi:hypothetical protein Patl1_23920 [Pistacia atlantica]|uniref:Uncharacterized protein n=1 Tax=Pistacia atlantica TaxID=434234 RepID=A0ACC0ZY60_9ROSI|nr:hypothetical protein Patl1_23920 [Pistacia atlantica]